MIRVVYASSIWRRLESWFQFLVEVGRWGKGKRGKEVQGQL